MSDLFGYSMREPYESEAGYFKANPNVSGMASEDNRIVLNPFAPLSASQRDAVARNEALRLWMRQRKFKPNFELTESQKKAFAGTPYAGDLDALKQSIIARILSGDPSAGSITMQQKIEAERLKGMLEGGLSGLFTGQ